MCISSALQTFTVHITSTTMDYIFNSILAIVFDIVADDVHSHKAVGKEGISIQTKLVV